MRCSNCGSENPSGKKFCGDCGRPLANLCPKCGAYNPPAKQFCGDCGAMLATGNSAAQSAASAPSSPSVHMAFEQAGTTAIEGERKTVTALFADLKGSTEMMETLDPEEARAVIDPALQIMVAAVRRYEGYVVQSTGDGIFALLGAPAAYEDHPQRGVYAALQMQHELREYAQRLADQGKPALEFRIGINTGEVVVRTVETGGKVEYAPIGHTANLASRLQALAPAGSIAVSEHTRSLVEGYFDLRALGPLPIRGINQPVNVYEATGLGPLRTHFQLSIQRGLTKFVGREREVAAMERSLELATSGHGQIVAVVADAGTGKSRLFYEFKAMLPSHCYVLEAYSISHGKASAWLPVIELLRSYFAIQDQDDQPARREKISVKLEALDPVLGDMSLYLFRLLGVVEGPDPLAQMDPHIKRQRTLDAIKRIILRESLVQPLVLIFEDLHWIDNQTQASLDLLADSIVSARVLLMVNYRPEYRHGWVNKTHYSQLRLESLAGDNAAAMLNALVGDTAELDPRRRMIIERTQGNPFFIEEMLQSLFDEGVLARNGVVKIARPFSQLRLPRTVQGILAARIDRQSSEHKHLLQTLAVIGRESRLDLIGQIVPIAEPQLQQMLAELGASDFIYEQPAYPQVEFVFKHALTQEVAYNSVLIERRKQLHERIGAAIEEIWSGRLDDHLSELARHYERSGNTRKALDYLGRAGHQARTRSSHAEAAWLFTSALELLKTLPETPERVQQELALQLGLGPALQCIKGWTAPEVASVYARARELCRQLGETTQLFTVLYGLSRVSFVRAQYQTAREQTQQLLSIAQNLPDADVLLVAHWALGQTLSMLGEHVPARTHLECASSLYDPARHRSLAEGGFNEGVASLVYAAWTEWFLGYPDQAVARVEQARALAEELSQTFSLCFALASSSVLHTFRREGEAALKFADESIRLATDHGFQQLLEYSICFCGGALVECGQEEQAVARLHEGLAALDALGSGAGNTRFLGWQAAAYGRLGRVEEGLAAVAEGFAVSQRTGERFFEAELHRLTGDLLLQRDAQESESKVEGEAEVCFRRAIEVARRQQAKSLELRATMSLARLLASQGLRKEALAMIAEIYNWFTEGFDTADLKEAKALLDELTALNT